jgi:WD40 repeat protein
VAISPDGRLALIGGTVGRPAVVQLETGRELRRLEMPPNGNTCYALTFTPDGRYALEARAGSLPDVGLWDVTDAKELRKLDPQNGWNYCVACSPDGSCVAAGGTYGRVHLWQLETGRESLVVAGHEGRVHSVAFSPDGELLLTGGQDGTVRLWRLPGDERPFQDRLDD